MNLKTSWIDTPLSPMIAIADEEILYLLEFKGRRGLEKEIEQLQIKMNTSILPGSTAPIRSIEKELKLYFEGTLKTFNTPFDVMGTPFQRRVWEELLKIPYGETISYLDLAKAIEKPTACRAVAQANGANQLALIIPCHRVINSNGDLGGYGGGVMNKQWLLRHEKIRLSRNSNST